GLPSDRFIFEGFLPAKAVARRARLELVKEEPRTLIFYEAPHRILECIEDLVTVFGPERPALLAREITKTFETLKGLRLGELQAWVAADSNQQRGECVLLVGGWPAPEGEEAVDAQALRVLDLLLAELPLKRAAALAAEITGVRKNLLCQVALARYTLAIAFVLWERMSSPKAVLDRSLAQAARLLACGWLDARVTLVAEIRL